MSSYWTVDDDSVYLSHFGVKGMKWGVRKQKRALNTSMKRINKNIRKAANTKNEKKRAKFMSRWKDANKSYESAKKALEKSGYTVAEIMAGKVGRSGDIYAIRRAKAGRNKSEDQLQNELLRRQRRRARAMALLDITSDIILD